MKSWKTTGVEGGDGVDRDQSKWGTYPKLHFLDNMLEVEAGGISGTWDFTFCARSCSYTRSHTVRA